MVTAQEVFDEMLRLGIRPSLREIGFQGSGSTFVWPSKNDIAQLGVQKSAFSDRNSLKFTINVTVANRAAWDRSRIERPSRPKVPAPNTAYGGDLIWQRRIGKLLPAGEDHWWWLSAESDWTGVANEVVDAVSQHVLPELLRHLTP